VTSGPGVADAVDTVVGFARTLRAAGVDATPGRLQALVDALAVLDPTDRAHLYWAGRTSLCATRDDVARYDRVFEAYFAGEAPHDRLRAVAPPRTSSLRPDLADALPPDGAEDDTSVPVAVPDASSAELLRHRDFAAMGDAERAMVDRLLDRLRLPGEVRRTRRHRPGGSRSLDRRRILRDVLRQGGEPGRLHRQERRLRPRRIVLVVDVSGSMSAYATALLRFAHAASVRGSTPTEVFTLGTRLTRVTAELGHRDPDTAMAAVSRAVPDWSGGTRLGPLLKELLDRWGQRGLVRGAVVVVLSDGWERGDVALLATQMARLARLSHRVVWANPRKAREGFEPTAAGLAASLPHVDDFVSGHSIAALEELAEVVLGHRRAPVGTKRGSAGVDPYRAPGVHPP
jgi:uncharacterized protein with von Willebrand factor type A (vWA) domain